MSKKQLPQLQHDTRLLKEDLYCFMDDLQHCIYDNPPHDIVIAYLKDFNLILNEYSDELGDIVEALQEESES